MNTDNEYRPNPAPSMEAVAELRGSEKYPKIAGVVRLHSGMRGVVVHVDIVNLPVTQTGFFALHLHEGQCGSGAAPEPFGAAGGHYNPSGAPHPRHAGDFPPLLRLQDGSATLTFVTDRFSLAQAIGRAIVVHLGADDFTSQPSGAAGERIACGVVRACR